MKIYILRHEDRTMDATFFSPLTQKGLEKSQKLIKVLKAKKINKIYSSPYIRTLQTVHPYSKYSGIKINLEYSLSEIQHPHIIPEKSYQVTLPEYIAESFNYNPKYSSMIYPNSFIYPEDEKNVSKRVKKFLEKLLQDKLETNDHILIVGHQIVMNSLLKVATKNMEQKVDFDYNYPKGALTQIFNKDEWLFESINWEKI